MDMTGPPTEPADSVVAIKAGRITRFADRLHAVMGLEWIDGALYRGACAVPLVVPRYRWRRPGGRARSTWSRGLGPDVPAYNGITTTLPRDSASGMDGYLYIAVGDEGTPTRSALDGSTNPAAGRRGDPRPGPMGPGWRWFRPAGEPAFGRAQWTPMRFSRLETMTIASGGRTR